MPSTHSRIQPHNTWRVQHHPPLPHTMSAAAPTSSTQKKAICLPLPPSPFPANGPLHAVIRLFLFSFSTIQSIHLAWYPQQHMWILGHCVYPARCHKQNQKAESQMQKEGEERGWGKKAKSLYWFISVGGLYLAFFFLFPFSISSCIYAHTDICPHP